MISRLPEYFNYTNKFIPVSTDSTVLKIVKLSGLIFFGPFAFIVDYALKVLADKNITKEEGSGLSPLVKDTLNNTEKILDMPPVEQVSIGMHAGKMNLAIEENESLGIELPSLVEKTPDSTERQGVQPVIEQIPTEMHLTVQEEVLEVGLSPPMESRLASTETPEVLPVAEQASIEVPVDKYAASLLVQKKTLETYLSKNFEVNSQDFLRNLQQFVAKGSIDFKFVPIFGKGPFSIHEHLVKIIERLLKEHSSNELPSNYKEYTCALRGAIRTKEYKNNKFSDPIRILIQELCYSKFMGTVLTDLQEETLENAIRFDPSRNMTSSNISKLTEVDNEILHKQPKTVRQSILLNYEKACNAAGFNSDQLSSANIPELRSIHRVKQDGIPYDVYYVRYPTPTIETAESFLIRFIRGNATAIAPEFRGFLDSIQGKRKPFLYVNHQYMDKKNKDPILSADNNRAEAIQEFEKTYAEVFHFLSLPFDGPVIKEISKKKLEDWKGDLVSNMIGEKEGFKIPKKFKESATSKKKEMEQLFDDLYSLYFPGKSELDETERKVLLVIFYSYLKEYFKAKYKIRIMASVCKDNKDRGNMSACIDEALFNLRLGRENNQQALKDLHLRILSPFIFREEGIVGHRLKFLTDLLDHIATLKDEQKKNIQEFQVNNKYQIIDQWIPRSNEDMKI